uniref:SCP domain-containing protein n=1 Tax=Angiostrongylus cantonensis TaxID=6313 RepID=A0A0K0D1T1_ANGCA
MIMTSVGSMANVLARQALLSLLTATTVFGCAVGPVTAICNAACTMSTGVGVGPIPATALSITGTLTTTNPIMANWSRDMWQSVVNRVARNLATGPFRSNIFTAFATLADAEEYQGKSLVYFKTKQRQSQNDDSALHHNRQYRNRNMQHAMWDRQVCEFKNYSHLGDDNLRNSQDLNCVLLYTNRRKTISANHKRHHCELLERDVPWSGEQSDTSLAVRHIWNELPVGI